MSVTPIEELVRNFQGSAHERIFQGQWGETRAETHIGHTRIGRVCRITHQTPDIKQENIEQDQVESEQAKLDNAINAALFQIESIREEAESEKQPIEISASLPDMMETYSMFIMDWQKKIKNKISEENLSAAKATATVRDAAIQKMKERGVEKNIEDFWAVADLILRKIRAEEGEEYGRASLADAPYGSIVIADELAPSDGIYFQTKGVRGIICRHGSPNGHVATLAKELGIPCLFSDQKLGAIHDDMPVIVDTQKGIAILNPSEATIRSYEYSVMLEERKNQKREEYYRKKIRTKDSVPANVYANMGFTATADRAKINRADGIGLYRTELLLTNWKSEPSIEIQRHAYRYAMNALDGNAVTIRLMDNEGDKGEGKWIRNADRWAVMENQVEAILLASADTGVPAHILLPIVRDVKELKRLREMISRKVSKLKEQNIKMPAPKMGMMVEIAATALEFEQFEPHADFFSFGTNDLNAWLNGQIRNEGRYSAFDDPLRPSSLKILRDVTAIADKAKKHISICGEIASDPAMIPVLLGLGLRKFSTGVEEVLDIKEAIENIDTKEAKLLVEALIKEPDSDVRREMLHAFNEKHGVGQYLYKPATSADADTAQPSGA